MKINLFKRYIFVVVQKKKINQFKRSKLTNRALYAAQAASFKCIFETKIVFSSARGFGDDCCEEHSDELFQILHLMLKSGDPPPIKLFPDLDQQFML